MLGLILLIANMLQHMVPVMVIAIFAACIACTPLILQVRFTIKAKEVMAFIKRLQQEVGKRGIVHFSHIQYGRIAVWNASFQGHR